MASVRTVGSAQELSSDVSALLQQGGGFPGKSGFVPVALWCSAVLDKQIGRITALPTVLSPTQLEQ